MLSAVLRMTFGLMILFGLAVAAVCAVPYDESQLQAFMTSPDNCTGPCLLGIRPGKMTVKAALKILEAHPWVQSTQLSAPGNGYGQIRWQWSGAQPKLIDDTYPGRITFYWDEAESGGHSLRDSKIETIAVQTNIRMYSLQAWYGRPNTGTAGFRFDKTMGYSAGYHFLGTTIILSSTMLCPVSLLTYWNARTVITVSIGWGTSTFVPPTDMVKMC